MRLADWDKRLAGYIEEVRHISFEWGRHDCFTFAVKCEEAVSGVTRFPELYKAEYHSQFGANKAFMKNGYRGMVDCINRRCVEINQNMLRRGDWAAFDTPEGLAIGVYAGNKVVAVGENGLVFVEPKDVKKAWEI